MIDKDVLDAINSVQLRNSKINKIYAFKVITPMFGGGVEAGKNDEDKLIRETEIRGLLRFWWRATIGANCSNEQDLFKKESELWGSTENPSKVAVRVSSITKNKDKASYGSLNEKFGYVLFPYAPNKKENKQEGYGKNGVEFNLTVSYPGDLEADKIQEIETALWAWANFGGIGARTRKGCGALFCPNFAPEDAEDAFVPHVFDENGARRELTPTPRNVVREWPTLKELLLKKEALSNDYEEVWQNVVETYRTFRQGEGFGRNPGQQANRPGRSRWPEPDSLRRITNSAAPRHQQQLYNGENVFPRAELGAPIIFHFKDKGDPDNQEVKPVYREAKDRMTSPFILRPLVFRDGQASPCVLRFNAPKVEKVVLGNSATRYDVVRADSANYRNSPLGPANDKLSPTGSALEGFLNYLVKKGYTKIR